MSKESDKELRECFHVSPYVPEDKANDLMKLWNDICTASENRTKRMVLQLKDMNIKAVHPNDGWVKRRNGVPYEVHFAYPDFMYSIEVGDKVALTGWDADLRSDTVAIYEVTEIIPWGWDSVNYAIKPINESYYYREDGQLELVKPIKKSLRKTFTNESLIIFLFVTLILTALFRE